MRVCGRCFGANQYDKTIVKALNYVHKRTETNENNFLV